MDATVEAAVIGAVAALIGVGGTVVVAVTAARSTRKTNQATIDAAQADARRALEAAREAQLADRYSKALEQVDSASLDMRIGGIYALEGLARASPEEYQPTVIEFLTAFVREHSRTPPEGRPERWPLPDVQTALTVASRRNQEHDIRRIDLSGADLSGADLSFANLRHANLTNVNLAGADLTDADLTHSTLYAADLSRATLMNANLAHAKPFAANLTSANLINADLTAANLTSTNLTAARLYAADLTYTNLTDANLTSADLTNTILLDTDVTGAVWPASASPPPGWVIGTDSRLSRDPGQPQGPDTSARA